LIQIKVHGRQISYATDGERHPGASLTGRLAGPKDQTMIRDMVMIDEERCDGCGQCTPACAEGALRIVGGKARLVTDGLCDGLGACLGHCPRDAIRLGRREADAYDEAAVTAATRHGPTSQSPEPPNPPTSGCPASRFMQFRRETPVGAASRPDPGHQSEVGRSELTHWPVQLQLLPVGAPVLRRASLLLAADCVPIAYPEFHQKMLRGRAVAIACPKLDDTGGYLEKLTEMICSSDLAELIVAHMEVPCCTGLLRLALEARRRSGQAVPTVEVIVSTRGEILTRREIPAEAA